MSWASFKLCVHLFTQRPLFAQKAHAHAYSRAGLSAAACLAHPTSACAEPALSYKALVDSIQLSTFPSRVPRLLQPRFPILVGLCLGYLTFPHRLRCFCCTLSEHACRTLAFTCALADVGIPGRSATNQALIVEANTSLNVFVSAKASQNVQCLCQVKGQPVAQSTTFRRNSAISWHH